MRPRPSDSELLLLLHGARSGASECMEELLVELYPSIRHHICRQLRGRNEADSLADDIAQEALLRVIHGIGSCHAESPAALFSWVLVIARRVTIDVLRREHARESWVAADMDAGVEEASLRAWLSPPPSPAPASIILLDLLDNALQALPHTMVTVLRLRVQTEMTWPEIAQQVRTTAAGAKRRFQRAQQRLRKDVLARILRLPSPTRQTICGRLLQMGVTLPPFNDSEQEP